MRRTYWLTLLTALLMLALMVSTAVATTYHSITIDGNLTDWQPDEMMEADGPYTLYLTWDANNIYLGLTGAYLGDTAGQDKSFFACFDTNLVAGSGATADGYGSVSFNTNLFAPDYCYYFAGGSGWYEWSNWTGSAWNWNGWRNDGTYYNWPGNPGTIPGSELTVVRSDIGSPAAIRVMAWLTPEQPVPGPVEASWPTVNATGTGPLLYRFYDLTSLGSGLSPNAAVPTATTSVIINEVRTDHTGTDVDEYFELVGAGGTILDGLTYLVIGDGTGASGVIENVTPLAGSTMPADGFFVAATSNFTFGTPDLVFPLIFENSDNVTHLLVKGFSGSLAQDLDTNNDGILDVTPWTEVVDLIAIVKEENPPSTTEYHYGPPKVGPDGIYTPGHVYRCGSTWHIGPFDTAVGVDTPGAANPCFADAAVTKSGPAMASPGSNMIYAIGYENSGSFEATAVIISDTLPTGVSYVTDDSGLSCLACTVGATGTLTWYVGSVAPAQGGAFDLTALADAGIPSGTTVTNTVEITATGDADPANNTAQWSTIIASVDLAVTKTGPADPVRPGSQISYTVAYALSGSGPAQNVRITDTFPTGFSYVFHSASAPLTCSPAAGSLVCTAASVSQPGQVIITGTTPASPAEYVITNTADIAATNDQNAANNRDRHVNNLIVPITAIQYVPNPATDDRSSFVNSWVWVEGVVTADSDVFRSSSGGQIRYFIQSQDGGPWSGLYVYKSTKPNVAEGDFVLLYGKITEYAVGGSNQTELDIGVAGASQQIVRSGDPLPNPEVLDTGDLITAGTAEQWESVLTEFRAATVTNPDIGNGEWEFDDGSGATIGDDWAKSGGNTRLTYTPALYDYYSFIRGIAFQSYGTYKLEPRYDQDVSLTVIPPTVVSTIPPAGATGVSPHKPIYATFSEAMDPATINTGTFLLQGPGGAVAGTVSYDAATFTASFVPGAALTPNSHHTATLTTGVEDLSGTPLEAAYVWDFYTGPLDTTPPAITARYPVPEATEVPLGANVVITFSEELNPATVVAGSFSLTGPYGSVAWDAVSYDAVAYEVTLNPHGLLLPTARYTATVGAGVTDWAGLPVPAEQRTWSFTTQAEPEMLAFHGDIHNHTSYSDGSGTPQQAFASAIACGLDFMAVTDHSYAISDAEWADTLARADAATSPTFVGLRGFEYTQGAEGHANGYNTVRHATRALVAGCAYCDYTPNLEQGVTVEGFYHWLAITGTQALDGAGTVLQFNHPSWINFNDWAYHPEVEEVAELEEVGNGWDSSYVFSWDEWIRSLDYGWQVGAANNSDNHNYDWGCISPHRTGVVMADLTKDDLLGALRARRTFATEDSNYDLFFQANGYWMGAEIPNTGQIAFHLWGSDPDGELTTLVQLYTANGQLVAETQPNSAGFDWTFNQAITPGVHYFFALAVQADGDRIVSSPIWTTDVEDVRLTDLTIQPSIPTIYNPSLLTARVSNRSTTTQTLTVAFEANGVPVGTVPVTIGPCAVGPCEDGWASLGWQSAVTGPVTVTAAIQGAPAGDNPDDNYRTLYLEVTDEKIPLILIDTGHNNIGVDPHGISQFVDDMTLHGYNVLFNLDQITASDLNTETVKLLILNAYGPDPLTPEETQAVGNFVAAGGSLWLNGVSDYGSQLPWAADFAPRVNGLVASIETAAGSQIPIRFNDDEVLDGNDNNGYPWGILWHTFPVSATQGVGMNVLKTQSWSVASLTDRNGGGLSQGDIGADGFVMVLGDLDPGSGMWGYPNRTHNTDADGATDAYIYPSGEYLPAGAGYDLPGQPGRLFFYGDSNDPFNIFAYVAGDGKQNELFNLEVVMWLLGDPLHKMTVAEARYDPELDDTPETLDRLVWVEGVVTAGYGEFFDVLYVQDDTGGITVFAPAGTASGAVDPVFSRGDCVRVVGTVDVYQGDTELQFFETEQVHVLAADCVYSPTLSLGGSGLMPLTTYSASLEINEGWLVVVTGTVTAREGNNIAWLDDGSGPVRLFLDGYNGTWSDVNVGDRLAAAGMVSEDGAGPRIRIRNHSAHPLLPDDVRLLPNVTKEVTPTENVPLGGVVTYTIVLTNPNQSDAFPIELTDALPAEVDFGGWVVQPAGASVVDDVVTWQGNVAAGGQVEGVFTATVGTDPALYGLTVTNTASFVSEAAGSGSGSAAFAIEQEPPPSLAIVKDVAPTGDVILGDVVTYTITLANSGEGEATGVVMTDILPVEVSFGGWLVQPAGAIQANGAVTWTGDIPATPGQVVLAFTATVGTDPAYVGRTVTNTATFVSDNAGTHSDGAVFAIIAAPEPDLSTSTKVSAYPGQRVMPGDLVTYTITLNNTGDGNATATCIDVLSPYYTVYDAMDLTESPAGTLTWSGVVPAGQQTALHFVVQVAGPSDLPVGITVLDNGVLIDDGLHPAFLVSDLTPPWARIYGVYMPLVSRNY